MEMRWDQPKCIGDLPPKRSGHTFTSVENSFAIMIGGCVHNRRQDFTEKIGNVAPGPTNDVFKVDMGSETECYWTKFRLNSQSCPKARWHHSATKIDDGRIVVFGGFSGDKTTPHLNDVWILDINSEKWSQVVCPGGVTQPKPRGAHSASLIGRKIYIFGGYGGYGYTRQDFNDLFTLDIDKWIWSKVETICAPPVRSGHQSAVVDGKLFVMGGWCASEQFDDVYTLNEESSSWEKLETASGGDSWGACRWNFTAVSVYAVPSSKVFVFGGNSGDLGSECPLGTYLNDVQVLENTGVKKDSVLSWTRPSVVGTLPSPRADTQMIYSAESGRLVVFGGWSNRWHDDMHTCKVDQVVGPPYNIEELASTEWKSSTGPVTGNSPMVLRGLGFSSVNGGKASIRFACPTGFIDVDGTVRSDNEISLLTPEFQEFGPIEAQVRLKLGSRSFSNSAVSFSYFAVTDCSTTLAFGPGILEGNAPNVATSIIIQAKDKDGNDRSCGMDQFFVHVREVKGSTALPKPSDNSQSKITSAIEDNKDGTYKVQYFPPHLGKFQIDIKFAGTFGGRAGIIRGSPFFMTAVGGSQGRDNALDGQILHNDIIASTKALKSFSATTRKGLQRVVQKDDLKALVSVKEHLRNIIEKSDDLQLRIDRNRSGLVYLKHNMRYLSADKLRSGLEAEVLHWKSTKEMIPITKGRISEADKIWKEKTQKKIESYEVELENKRNDFQKLNFWMSDDQNGAKIDSITAKKGISDAEKNIRSEMLTLEENSHLCSIFELHGCIDPSRSIVDEMKANLNELVRLWDVDKKLEEFICASGNTQWNRVNSEELELAGKGQLKSLKTISKSIRWCKAYQGLDQKCKNFLTVIPLISQLGGESMRHRHWHMLKKVTSGESSILPCESDEVLLSNILDLHLHNFVNEVEEICDQAMKEEKMEKTLAQIESRWSSIGFIMNPFKRAVGEDVPLLSIGEEDFEALENDQLIIQGMLASRFLPQFEDEVKTWNECLYNVNEIFLLMTEIQRTWSYLEPLFIHSEEVRRELPEDAARFIIIDKDIRGALAAAWETRNIKEALNIDGLYGKLEAIQGQLELCKKSLADFLDGRRRQFPRYYFVSEADLLDILSNGSTPEKILSHIPKVYLSTKTLVFSDEKSPEGRPIATEFVAGVGEEVCKFEPPVALEGKVEVYMQTVLDAQKRSIFATLQRSLIRYDEMERSDWILTKDDVSGRPVDPAQTTLLVMAINYVAEVEQVFCDIKNGNHGAMSSYSEKQVKQLNDLITLTQSNLSKGDRTRVMVSITMDAHGRDIVQKMIRNKVEAVDSFMWQSQLKHKFRVPPKHARYQYRDPELRGAGGERAEIAICDAILPYDYEYLGNGPRLVITPLTDRIYVTATQALNLKMGCAPAGPAGTGKTETTKDLANALAKLIYVINCKSISGVDVDTNIFRKVICLLLTF